MDGARTDEELDSKSSAAMPVMSAILMSSGSLESRLMLVCSACLENRLTLNVLRGFNSLALLLRW